MQNKEVKNENDISRRDFLKGGIRAFIAFILGGVMAKGLTKSKKKRMLWQVDPAKCTQCGRCATECVLTMSAVKCMHNFSLCGYCDLCFGYFHPDAKTLNESFENQLCPTGAIKRTFVEAPYYEYTIDENLCIGCAKCVLGCNAFGNGSLYLQVNHELCVDCNFCTIARRCPSQAFTRVYETSPYIKKEKGG